MSHIDEDEEFANYVYEQSQIINQYRTDIRSRRRKIFAVKSIYFLPIIPFVLVLTIITQVIRLYVQLGKAFTWLMEQAFSGLGTVILAASRIIDPVFNIAQDKDVIDENNEKINSVLLELHSRILKFKEDNDESDLD